MSRRHLNLGIGILLAEPNASPLPVSTVVPAISGTPTQGQVLSVSNGTWLNTPTSYAYAWKRDGVAIGGETASTYTLQAADVGALITATVTATNASGSTPANALPAGPVGATYTPAMKFNDARNSNYVAALAA